jgi:hypothetical protein
VRSATLLSVVRQAMDVRRSCESPDLAPSGEIFDAAAAKRRPCGIGADIGAVVPAALAFRMRARSRRDGESLELL